VRHFFGFVFGLLLGPVLLMASGWVAPRAAALSESSRGFLGVGELLTLAALAALALLVALILVPPKLTPLIPGMAGLLLAGLTVVHLLRPAWADRVPDTVGLPVLGSVRIPGWEGTLVLVETGLLLPLALALLVPLFFPSRWRSYRPRGAHALDSESESGFSDLMEEDEED